MAEGRPMFFQKVYFSGGGYKKITLLRKWGWEMKDVSGN